MPVKDIFSKEPVNFGRQSELDIAKGIAAIFMVLDHGFETLFWFFDPAASMELSYTVYQTLLGGSFAAPVFMFCMGISLCYSKKSGASQLLRRALGIAGIALLLELARTGIPGLIEWLVFRDPACVEYLYMMLCADILQFVALALLVMALFKKLKLKPAAMLAIAVVCSAAGQLLQGVSTGSYFGDAAAGFIWHSYYESYFPLLNWLIFPVGGYAFGHLWLRIKDKTTFFKRVTPVSWLITVLYFVSMLLVGEEYYLSGGNYYGLGTLDAMFAFIVCFAMIGLGYYINRGAGAAARVLASMGSRITSVFCIHWTIYGFLYFAVLCILGDNYLPQWTLFPIGVAVLIATDLLSRLYKRQGRNAKGKTR